jgi:hypothetical protein
MSRLNDITRDYLLIFVHMSSLVGNVMCNVLLILFHNRIPRGKIVILAAVSLASATFILVSHIKFAEIHERSRQYINSWKRSTEEVRMNCAEEV